MDFKSITAIVTGAAGGIGYAISEKLLSLGSKVLLTDLHLGAVEEKCNILRNQYGERVQCTKCDVTSVEMIEKAFETCNDKLGKPNLLVNNAGGGNEKNFKMTMLLNLEAPVNGTEMAIKKMGIHEGGQGGHVVNVASISGVKTVPCLPFYSATKTGLVSYSRNIGHAFNSNRTGVEVKCLCPSIVDTPIIHDIPKSIARDDFSYAATVKLFSPPYLVPEEVASALIDLLQNGGTGAVMVLEHGKPPYYI